MTKPKSQLRIKLETYLIDKDMSLNEFCKENQIRYQAILDGGQTSLHDAIQIVKGTHGNIRITEILSQERIAQCIEIAELYKSELYKLC